MHIVVIGGGVGGLATAGSLQKRGFEATVYEQASALTAVGAGVVVAPNSQRLLADVFGADLLPGAVHPTALHVRRWQDGVTISRQPLGSEARARFGAHYVAVHRADLLDALAAGLRPGSLHVGHRAVSVEQTGETVVVGFADGKSVTADLVVGADGIRSSVAATQGISTVPRACGYAAFRGTVPRRGLEDLGREHAAWLGPDRHFVHYPIRGGEVLNFVAIVPSPQQESESWSAAGDIGEARAHFADWDVRVRRILDAADSVRLWGLYDRPARDVLHIGRVVLVGDAAHPVLPFFAQGASLALEDAAVLGAMLADSATRDVERRLAAYSAARVPRVHRVQEVSHRNATMFHLPDGPQQKARDARLASVDGGDPMRDNGWLYGHDVRDDATAALAAIGEPA